LPRGPSRPEPSGPCRLCPGRAVELSDADTDRVGSENPDVWVTVRAGSSPSDFSANLSAPIFVADGRGHQVINEASDAPVRAPLFAGDAVEAAA